MAMLIAMRQNRQDELQHVKGQAAIQHCCHHHGTSVLTLGHLVMQR